MKTSDKVFVVFLVIVIGLNVVSYIDRKNKVDEKVKMWQEMADLNQEAFEAISRSLAEIKYSLNKLEGK
jgi:uncharacterized membrane protein (DUF106 family)